MAVDQMEIILDRAVQHHRLDKGMLEETPWLASAAVAVVAQGLLVAPHQAHLGVLAVREVHRV